MSMPSPPPGGSRASRSVKLVLMGVAGAALLYSCGPSVGAGLGALPYFWFLPNPFYRPPIANTCPPGTPNCEQAATSRGGGGGGTSSSSTSRGSSTTSDSTHSSSTSSQRGGFGSTGSTGSSSGS